MKAKKIVKTFVAFAQIFVLVFIQSKPKTKIGQNNIHVEHENCANNLYPIMTTTNLL